MRKTRPRSIAIDDLPPYIDFSLSQAASFSQTNSSSEMPDQPASKKQGTQISQLIKQVTNHETKMANQQSQMTDQQTQIAEILRLMEDQIARQDKLIAMLEKPHKSG